MFDFKLELEIFNPKFRFIPPYPNSRLADFYFESEVENLYQIFGQKTSNPNLNFKISNLLQKFEFWMYIQIFEFEI